MENKRLQYIDFYKFIGITLMVMGHVGFGAGFDKYIHAFHMPLFFFASGFCFASGKDFLTYLKHKAYGILVPYFAFSIITFLALRNINKISFSAMEHVIWINNLSTPIAGVWFLTALLWANILYYLIDRLENQDLIWFLSVLCFTIGGSSKVWYGTLPWSISQGLIGVLFMHIGQRMSMQKDGLKLMNSYDTVISFIVISVLIFINDDVNLRTLEYGNLPLCIFNASAMCSIIMMFCINTERLYAYSAYRFACRIGRYSICYLCLNQIAIRYSKVVCESVLNLPKGGISSVLVLMISFIAMIILTEVIIKTKLSMILGVKK